MEAGAAGFALVLTAGVCVEVGVTGAGVAVAVAVAVAVSEGTGAGERGRGGNRIQLSMSVTGPCAKLGKDKPAEIAKASVALAP